MLSKLGLLVHEQLVVCGRSDFIAEFEGQTANKARTFLMANLEKANFLDDVQFDNVGSGGSGRTHTLSLQWRSRH